MSLIRYELCSINRIENNTILEMNIAPYGAVIEGSYQNALKDFVLNYGGSRILNFSENTIQCLYGISAVEDFSP